MERAPHWRETHRGEASQRGACPSTLAQAPRGGRDEGGSHIHTQGQPARQTQGQELLDTPTWGQGNSRLCCTVELRGAGAGHPRRHCHAQGHPEMLSHTEAKRTHYHPHRRSYCRMHACTQPHHYKRSCHSRAHTCSHVLHHAVIVSWPPAVTVAVTQLNTEAATHINPCVHNPATSISLGSCCGRLEVFVRGKTPAPGGNHIPLYNTFPNPGARHTFSNNSLLHHHFSCLPLSRPSACSLGPGEVWIPPRA